MLFERVENGWGIAVFVPGVKGEIDHLFVGIPGIIGVILRQKFACRVADRRFAFLLEAQPPVSGLRGDRHRVAASRAIGQRDCQD